MYFNNSFHFKVLFSLFFHPVVSSPIQLLPHFSRHSCLSREKEEEKTLIRLFSGISRNGAQGVERDQTRKIAGLRGKVRGTHHLRVGFAHSDSQSERSWRWKRGRASDRCTNGKIIDIYINRDIRVRNCISFRF